jgi:hypothetical protein
MTLTARVPRNARMPDVMLTSMDLACGMKQQPGQAVARRLGIAFGNSATLPERFKVALASAGMPGVVQ